MKESNGRMIQEAETEFAIVCRAKNGDQAAVEWIWRKYKRIMVGMIGRYCYHLSQGEKESEAVMILLHKLEIFQPSRVRKSPDVWSFSYMLTSGMFHQRNKLMKAVKKERETLTEYTEVVNVDGRSPDGMASVAYQLDPDPFNRYNPEKVVAEKLAEPSEVKVERLMKMLTPFQRSLLKLRQAGMTVQQIADQMGCSFTKVRLHIGEAKQVARAVFEVSY